MSLFAALGLVLALASPAQAASLAQAASPAQADCLDGVPDRLDDAARARLATCVRAVPIETLVARARQSLGRLNIYGATLIKEERVGGSLLAPQTMEIVVRERPFAARLDVVKGPGEGRRVVYDSRRRPGELHAREGGLLGVVGAIWVSIDSSLTRRDTNHSVTEMGFGSLLTLIEREVSAAQVFGGLRREDKGFDERGQYCLETRAPPGATGLYSARARICLDLKLGLPTRMEIYDSSDKLVERFQHEQVVPMPDLGDVDFTFETTGNTAL